MLEQEAYSTREMEHFPILLSLGRERSYDRDRHVAFDASNIFLLTAVCTIDYDGFNR